MATENSTMTFMTTLTLGLALFSDILSESPKIKAKAMVNIATGKWQAEMMAVSFYQIHDRYPNEGEQYLLDPKTLEAYLRLVAYIKDVIRGIIDDRVQLDLDKQQSDLQALRNKLSLSNVPHPQGSVAELAKKLGVGKNEVRRMKAEGTLDAALAKL